MARYNEFNYNSGVLYGVRSLLTFSALPMTATALSYTTVKLEYTSPDGGTSEYVGFRIVRSQDGYPENEEDGIVLYELLGAPGALSVLPSAEPIYDSPSIWGTLAAGETAPILESGKFVYYRAWILKEPNSAWVPAGDAYTLLPSPHTLTPGQFALESTVSNFVVSDSLVSIPDVGSTTHERFMSYIPTVYTSQTNSMLDERLDDAYNNNDPSGEKNNTLLSSFLSGFSFTLDEFLTFAKLALPGPVGTKTGPAILALQANQFNVDLGNVGVTKTQKRLIRDAIPTYKLKGTLAGVKLFVEDVTGYKATLTQSPNRILDNQGSSFNIDGWKSGDAISDWIAGTNSSIVVSSDPSLLTTNSYSVDNIFCAQVTTTSTNAAISYGTSRPITRGIPVRDNTIYYFSFYVKATSSTPTVTSSVIWYDGTGSVLSGDAGTGAAYTASTSWGRAQSVWTSPAGAAYASISIKFATAQVYLLDMVQFGKPKTAVITGAIGAPRLASGAVDTGKVHYQAVHTFAVGDYVTINGISPSAYNLSNVQITEVTTAPTSGLVNGFIVASSAVGTYSSGGRVSQYFSGGMDYRESRGLEIFLQPDSINYLNDPSFEASGIPSWTITANSTVAVATGVGSLYDAPVGARCSAYKRGIRGATSGNTTLTSNASGAGMPTGTFYTFSIYAQIDSVNAVAAQLKLKVNGLLSTEKPTGYSTEAVSNISLTLNWQRFSVSLWVPKSSQSINLDVTLTGAMANIYLEVDAAQLEVGNRATDYFDGDLDSEGCGWKSTKHASWSAKYTNRDYRIGLLNANIKDYLPSNTPYWIDFYANTDVTTPANVYEGFGNMKFSGIS